MNSTEPGTTNHLTSPPNVNLEKATFGSGCFWCTEAIFQRLIGVEKVTSGYSGGKFENPTYREICTGTTGHAEVVQVEYNPAEVGFEDLLHVFWKTHDPTTLNQQGADRGTQYRSVIFYHNEEQSRLAEEYKKKLNESGAYNKPVVTEIAPLKKFFAAENYHQDYFNANGDAPYCQFVIAPKVDKLQQLFKDKLKYK
ncbi:MAG: peptide-methionine (S)-S-oxide reductase MsrA [Chitinophagales bacterium]